MKKQKIFFLLAVICVLIVITIPGWINDIPKFVPDDSQSVENTEDTENVENSENAENTEVQTELETVFDSTIEKEWVSNEEEFSAWDSKALYLQKNANIFEGFSMAEYNIEGKSYAVLYDEELILVFLDSGIEVMKKDTAETFLITDWYYSPNDFIFGATHLKRCDVNHDGVKEVIGSYFETGTGVEDETYTIIDVQNQEVLSIKYHINDFLFDIPNIEVVEETFSEEGERETIVVRYEWEGVEQTHTVPMDGVNVDEVNFVISSVYDITISSEDGSISVETAVIVDETPSWAAVNVLKITCDFAYLPEEKMFKVDKDTLRIEPYEIVYGEAL